MGIKQIVERLVQLNQDPEVNKKTDASGDGVSQQLQVDAAAELKKIQDIQQRRQAEINNSTLGGGDQRVG